VEKEATTVASGAPAQCRATSRAGKGSRTTSVPVGASVTSAALVCTVTSATDSPVGSSTTPAKMVENDTTTAVRRPSLIVRG